VVAQPGHVCLTTVPVSSCASDCAPLSGTLREAMVRPHVCIKGQNAIRAKIVFL
jgi:hypothetical protein